MWKRDVENGVCFQPMGRGERERTRGKTRDISTPHSMKEKFRERKTQTWVPVNFADRRAAHRVRE